MIYIQLIGILAFCILVLSFYKKKIVTILAYQITSNFIYFIHYFLLGGLSGAFCSLIGILRNIVFMKANNKKILVPIFILLYLIITIIFYENIYSILPMLGNSSYLISMVYNTKKSLLIGAIFNSIFWIVYAIFVSSYVGIITEVILLISNTMQLKKIYISAVKK